MKLQAVEKGFKDLVNRTGCGKPEAVSTTRNYYSMTRLCNMISKYEI
jgi:hypothetical protein